MDSPKTDLNRLADDAMHRDYPDRFSSRAEWDAYNARIDARERSYEYRALHGDLDRDFDKMMEGN